MAPLVSFGAALVTMAVSSDRIESKSAKRRARHRRAALRLSSSIDRSLLLQLRPLSEVNVSPRDYIDVQQHVSNSCLPVQYVTRCEMEARLTKLEVEFSASLQELRESALRGIGDGIAESLTNFGGHVAQQLQRCGDRIHVLEESIRRVESYWPSTQDKEAFVDLPSSVPGTPALILESQCNAVQTIQTAWRSFLGWSIGKACADKVAVQQQGVNELETVKRSAAPESDEVEPAVWMAPVEFSRTDANRQDGQMGVKEFWEIAQSVRRRLPHILQREPPMLMICDKVDNPEEFESADVKEEDAEKKLFNDIWDALVAGHPLAPQEWLTNEAISRFRMIYAERKV